MRPTVARMSDMPGPKVYNLWWGDRGIAAQKGVIQYAISPNRQRAAKNMFRNWLFNGYRRLAAQVPYFVVPFAVGYGTYTWAKSYDAWQNSKAAHEAGHAAEH
ncbi:cytochrome b-c1 complex subunit 8 [Abortiporus biennis]|nr:cytochrome b-c1 complex subunit 8 [Abortiporus biennis]